MTISIQDILLRLLPTRDKPTDTDFIAYGREQGRKEVTLAPSPLLNPTCGHLMTVYPTLEPFSFLLRCDPCYHAALMRQQQHNGTHEQEPPPNPYQQHLAYMQQQRQQKQAQDANFAKAVVPDITGNSTMIQLPTVRPDRGEVPPPLFHHPHVQKMEVEDMWLLNSQPVTPEEVPVVEEKDMDATATGLLALPASLKHMKRGA